MTKFRKPECIPRHAEDQDKRDEMYDAINDAENVEIKLLNVKTNKRNDDDEDPVSSKLRKRDHTCTPTEGHGESDETADATNDETITETKNLEAETSGGYVEERTEHSRSKFRIYKNLLVITVSFLCLFAAYTSLESLQSSINVAEGLGLIGLTIVYSTKLLSSLFLPSLLFSKFGMKWTIVISIFGYVAYVAASFRPMWGTLMPASVLLGLGASNLWTGQMSYMSTLSQQYSSLTGKTNTWALSRFFSIFYTVFHTGDVWGHLTASLVFSYKISENSTEYNFTCGTSFCPQKASNNSNLLVTDPIKIYTYSGFCLGCAILAAGLLAFSLDNIHSSQTMTSSSTKFLTAVIRQVRTSGYQKLLIPATLYRGLSQSFILADFNAAFTSCYLGVENVGFIMICYALFCSLGSFLFGKVTRWAGFHVSFIIAFILHGGMGVTLFVWVPSSDQKYVFFICVSLWALGYSVYSSVLAPLYSHVFPNRTAQAMSCFDLLQSLGAVLSYGLSSFLCTYVKLTIVLSFSVVSTVCVSIVILHERHNKSSRPLNT